MACSKFGRIGKLNRFRHGAAPQAEIHLLYSFPILPSFDEHAKREHQTRKLLQKCCTLHLQIHPPVTERFQRSVTLTVLKTLAARSRTLRSRTLRVFSKRTRSRTAVARSETSPFWNAGAFQNALFYCVYAYTKARHVWGNIP